jgi:hypothetical protein
MSHVGDRRASDKYMLSVFAGERPAGDPAAYRYRASGLSTRLSLTEWEFLRNLLLLVFVVQALSDPWSLVFSGETVALASANSAKSAELPSTDEA